MGSYWKDKFQNGGFGVRKILLHLSCLLITTAAFHCVLITPEKNRHLSFYHVPKDQSLRKKDARLIRNKTLKLESSHTRICSEHFEGGKKSYSWQLPSIFPWSKPCKERKLPTRRGLGFNYVLLETHLAVYLFIYLFIYLLQFNDNKQHHHKDSLQKSHRPHTKADHLTKKYIYIYNNKAANTVKIVLNTHKCRAKS